MIQRSREELIEYILENNVTAFQCCIKVNNSLKNFTKAQGCDSTKEVACEHPVKREALETIPDDVLVLIANLLNEVKELNLVKQTPYNRDHERYRERQ
jgi:hypothetical protein